ncbi:lipase secretion chaperone [Noviherbaspirillum sp.]|uniref:lipase secretion chaperone n=1 Tax=Noviherbaspirillum sp. TaxID=1926288 RepID=UPI002FDFF6AB
MIKKSTSVWLGAAATAAAVFVYLLSPAGEPPAAPVASTEQNLFPFVRSFEGTRPDGRIEVDGEDLVVSAELVRLFDYYLAAVGEKPLDAIRKEIELELDRRLKARAAGQAKELLARYLDYKTALVEVEKNSQLAGGTLQAIRGRQAALLQTRARFFSDKESQAMFGLEDAYDNDALARLEIGLDTSLTPEQKQQKLAALDAALPPALREAREEPFKIARLEESANKMRAEGATEDDIYRMRAAALTPEAAARMAEVDQEESAWKARIAAYLAQRNQFIASNPRLPETEREAYLDQLRQAQFNEDERKRLGAYE